MPVLETFILATGITHKFYTLAAQTFSRNKSCENNFSLKNRRSSSIIERHFGSALSSPFRAHALYSPDSSHAHFIRTNSLETSRVSQSLSFKNRRSSSINDILWKRPPLRFKHMLSIHWILLTSSSHADFFVAVEKTPNARVATFRIITSSLETSHKPLKRWKCSPSRVKQLLSVHSDAFHVHCCCAA